MFAFIFSVITIISGLFAFFLQTGSARTTAFVIFVIAFVLTIVFAKNSENF